MLLFLIIVILLTVSIIVIRKMIRSFKKKHRVMHSLFPPYGGPTYHENQYLDPDEYIYGSTFIWSKGSKQFVFKTGREGHCAPAQALAILEALDDIRTLELRKDLKNQTKRHLPDDEKAQIDEVTSITDERTGITTITWSFDRPPMQYDICSTAREQMAERIMRTFVFVEADRWPLYLSRVKPGAHRERELVALINNMMRTQGWIDSYGNTRYDVKE